MILKVENKEIVVTNEYNSLQGKTGKLDSVEILDNFDRVVTTFNAVLDDGREVSLMPREFKLKEDLPHAN